MFMRMFLTGATWKTGLARRLAPILDGVRHFVADSVHRPSTGALAWKSRAQIGEILTLAWKRIGFQLRRLDNLAAKLAAGTLRPPRPRTKTERTRAPRPAQPRLPGARQWIYRLAQPAAASIEQLRATLATDAEFAALIAAAPNQAGRVIRPLYRMLGLDLPEALKLPPRPRKPRSPRPAPEAAKQRTHADLDQHYRLSQVPRKWRLAKPDIKKKTRSA